MLSLSLRFFPVNVTKGWIYNMISWVVRFALLACFGKKVSTSLTEGLLLGFWIFCFWGNNIEEQNHCTSCLSDTEFQFAEIIYKIELLIQPFLLVLQRQLLGNKAFGTQWKRFQAHTVKSPELSWCPPELLVFFCYEVGGRDWPHLEHRC